MNEPTFDADGYPTDETVEFLENWKNFKDAKEAMDFALKALKKLWQFQWRNISFSPWLYKIATNEVNQYFRRTEYKKSVSLEELQEQGFELISSHDPESELIEAQEKLKQHQDFLEIQKKIVRLPAKYQEVIALRFFEKKQINEIAEILGKKEGTIKSLLHRAVERLRETD